MVNCSRGTVLHHQHIVFFIHHPKSSVHSSAFIFTLPSFTCPHPPLTLKTTIIFSVSMRVAFWGSFGFYCFSFFCLIPYVPFKPNCVIKTCLTALAGVAQWIECWPENKRVTSSIPSQGTYLGCGPGPQ